jgi:hypothetical protein
MAATRGSWNLMRAIQTAWNAASLDDTFRAYWTDPNYTQYEPLNFQDPAPGGAPGPYCVFEIVSIAVRGHSSGKTSTTFQQHITATIRFHIHAQNQLVSGTRTSAITIAQAMAVAVAAAFDPDNAALSMLPDTEINVIRGPDRPFPEGEEEIKWLLEYDVEVDCTYDL